MIHPPTIFAPAEVVATWQKEVARALAAAGRAHDSQLVDALRFVPREVAELVTHLSDALTHAAGILLASVSNATPGMRDVLDSELRALVAQEQCRRHVTGRWGEPIDVSRFSELPCEHVTAGVATDDGCEGGTA